MSVAWHLHLRTFAGIVAGASHYMASLTGRVEDVEVSYVLNAEDARALSKSDFTWKPGDWSTSFRTKGDAKAGAVAAFRHLAGDRDVLLLEEYENEVLAGPDDLVAAGRDVAADDDAWWAWKSTFVSHERDTQFGYNAPPSVRRGVTVVVQRTPTGAWEVRCPAATVETADQLAERAHHGQVDKIGQPYINHPRAVAEMLRPHGANAVMAGLLHDVVEDTDVTLDDLRAAGYPDEVVQAVDAVTRRPGETYMDMVRRAAQDPLGRLVKLADNAHNTSRLGNLDDEDVRLGLTRRYARARRVLRAAGARGLIPGDPEGADGHGHS